MIFKSVVFMITVLYFIDPVFTGEDVEFKNEESRAKTAPSKRKSWSHEDIKLRTVEGQPICVEPPGKDMYGTSK